jgi:hypothetical protein
MTESVRLKVAEQPSDISSSVEGPPAGTTFLSVSIFPASGSCGCSMGSVDPRPLTQTHQSQSEKNSVAFEIENVVPRQSALETTDALPKNFSFGGNGLLFFVDRLFHRRS